MDRICRHCNQAFEVTDGDLAFYDKVSPVFAGKKELIPPPELCPECRRQRRLSFLNERNIYARKCTQCGKDVISIYSPDKSVAAYCRECFFADGKDDLTSGFDPNTSIAEQFSLLYRKVPRIWMIQKEGTENSIYCNCVGRAKNCYLTFQSGSVIENCHYCYIVRDKCDTCIDCSYVQRSSLCYECQDCTGCYRCFFSRYCQNCTDSAFLFQCIGCSDCFGCSNLRHKQYYIFNKPYSKEGYFEEMGKYRQLMASHAGLSKIKREFEETLKGEPRIAAFLQQCERSSGDGLSHCKNCDALFDSFECEDGKNGLDLGKAKDFMDLDYYGSNAELILDSLVIGSSAYRLGFTMMSWDNVSNLYYCDSCTGCQDCFLCVGLSHKRYSILNRQYTKEEYEALVPKIIAWMREDGEWGEFFDPSLSPFGYNETVAQEYYPLEKEEALRLGFNWSDYVAPPPQVEKIVKASQLPDSIRDVPDAILEWAVECEVSGRPFRIIKQELKFLREHGLPLPRRHPDVRHLDRMKLRNPRQLFDRTCMKCSKPISTTYSPDRPETVYCEECYLKEVY